MVYLFSFHLHKEQEQPPKNKNENKNVPKLCCFLLSLSGQDVLTAVCLTFTNPSFIVNCAHTNLHTLSVSAENNPECVCVCGLTVSVLIYSSVIKQAVNRLFRSYLSLILHFIYSDLCVGLSELHC